MSDPSQLSSAIADLQSKTQGLTGSANGDTACSGKLSATYVKSSVGAALTAAGTTRADALQLAAAVNQLSTVGASTGVVLPDLSLFPGAPVIIFNAGANACQVYATGSQTIDGVAGATGVPLTNAKRAIFIPVSATAWLSAQLGVVSA